MWVANSLPYLTPRTSDAPDPWAQEAAQAGGAGTQRLREVTETSPPPAVADALQLPTGMPAVVRRRVMLLDDTPVELTDSWYPASFASGTPLAEQRKIKGGAVALLSELGYHAHEVLEDIAFRPATAPEAELLHRPEGTPVIVLRRTVLTQEGTPFEVSVMTMLAEGRLLRYRLTVG
ncbi:GntR family transcriptional regulator [Thermomonospora umbrina]|uniref:UTRA domain-containing protein n=1 Tax=Thermomonospora umbrina TaxID=111806 RepID=A0A3D9SXS0_9ACTN|nr:UTRA domain-containing protein [Thermomonospora umbrina]REF00358.1 UTRA domain-containing protein [Thermomonospora umbrina]